MRLEEANHILKKYGQEHILQYYDELPEVRQERLLQQIADIDWTFLEYLHGEAVRYEGHVKPLGAYTLDEQKAASEANLEAGLQAIREDKLCLLLLAGGQGTRLGYDKPKGCFNIGITHEMTIFQLLIEHTLEVVKQADHWIHLYIMTSELNEKDTEEEFRTKNYYGYHPDYIHFFVQETNPVTDTNGRVLMKNHHSILQSPNGNGGWFSSMERAGLLQPLLESGTEWINVFSVDNVLQRIADPVFLGATIRSGRTCGAKVVQKNAPDEKVGAICLQNGHPHIIEYYELSETMQQERNADGTLTYGYGVILNYLFPIRQLRATLDKKMPLHVVHKAVTYMNDNGEFVELDAPTALKYETLALDLIREMDDCLVYEVERNREFAPVKNKTGVDSVDSARKLLEENGYEL